MSRQEVQSSLPSEEVMLAAFREQSRLVIAESERFRKVGHKVLFGIEVEYGIVDSGYVQASEADRNSIIQDHPDYLDTELGASQLEMRTEPLDLVSDPSTVLSQLVQRDNEIRESVASRGLKLVSHGTNPFVPTMGIVRSSLPKYKLVPDHHNSSRRKDLQTVVGTQEFVDVGDAAIIGITNSVQANIEAFDDEDAIDKLNRSLQIGPMALSLFGNARFLETKDTGIQDIRMIGWGLSHDTRSESDMANGEVTRVGLPLDYYGSLSDYFAEIEKYPFILDAPEAALSVGIGLHWRDTRIKVVDDSLVVEFRPVSTQATPSENFAAMMFYTGRLLWSQQNNEEVLTMQQVKENREAAMLLGSRAELWTKVDNIAFKLPSFEAMRYEIVRAARGLKAAGIDGRTIDETVGFLEHRNRMGNPSACLAEARHRHMLKGEKSLGALALSLQDTKGIS
ncbi:hypothetical protein HGB25_02935 [Candidatus Saccharibacteria bacterium]|nr:hypothetical protein [Candidatus Saccharibacteria bacterium]